MLFHYFCELLNYGVGLGFGMNLLAKMSVRISFTGWGL